MKRKVVLILLAAMLLLCGCQPTPETEIVPDKGADIAEEKINATALPTASPEQTETEGSPDATEAVSSPWEEAAGQAVFPERWEDNIRTDHKEMIISADVVGADMDAYPVYLLKRDAYNADDLRKLAELMFPNATAWRDGIAPSREFLMETMLLVKDSDMSEEDKKINLEELNATLAQCKVSDEDNIPCSGVADIPFKDGGGRYSVFTENGGGSISLVSGELFAYAYPNALWAVQPKSWFRDNDPDKPEFTVDMSLEDAVSKAEVFLAEMGIEGLELYRSEEARCVRVFTNGVRDTGWYLYYIRTYEYYPFSAADYDASVQGPFMFGSDPASYAPALNPEMAELYVTEEGVMAVGLKNPYEMKAKVNENVELMDFEELTANIKNLFTAAISDPYQSEGYYVLEEMVLTVVPQQKKNSSELYLMPVWVCKIGLYVSVSDGLGVSHFYLPGDQIFDEWLTVAFNAIDGTRVTMPLS